MLPAQYGAITLAALSSMLSTSVWHTIRARRRSKGRLFREAGISPLWARLYRPSVAFDANLQRRIDEDLM